MTKAISDSERLFLEDGVEQGIRTDGRGLTDFRPMVVALEVISTANGSARVKNEELDVIVAVKVCLHFPAETASPLPKLVSNCLSSVR